MFERLFSTDVSAPGERDQSPPVNHYTTGGFLREMEFFLILGHISRNKYIYLINDP